MTRLHVFADEAGCLEFARNNSASKYFILCTVAMKSCEVGTALLDLRRKLIWENQPIGDYFHATTDKQIVRDAVFELLGKHDFTIQATVMEKSKAKPHIRETRPTFYKYGWFYHFRNIAPKIMDGATELVTTSASIGTRKERAAFGGAVDDVLRQVVKGQDWRMNFCPAASDPCVQVADYCAWALQRKWERQDERSYALIKGRIIHEYDLWSHGDVHYY